MSEIIGEYWNSQGARVYSVDKIPSEAAWVPTKAKHQPCRWCWILDKESTSRSQDCQDNL